MTLREIFTTAADGVSTVFNWFLDTNIFILIGMFVILVMGPYYAFTFLRAKETGKKVVGGFFALGSIFFYYLLIDVLIK
jgi:hypothetical protein|tara:strand:- start:229 stop:465 length:237 start_codon:yes stop_codon:yes gene_type:complete